MGEEETFSKDLGEVLKQVAQSRKLAVEIVQLLQIHGDYISELDVEFPGEVREKVTSFETETKKIERQLVEHEEEKQQLWMLADVSQIINSSLGLGNVLNEVMDRIVMLTGAERGFLMLRNEAGAMQVEVARNLDRKSLKEKEHQISQTVVKQVVSSGEAVLTTNAQDDPRFGQEVSIIRYHLRSILCVPLKLRGEVMGVIYADSRVQMGLFKKKDLRMLGAFANQAAVAIENARLFETLQHSHEKLEGAYEETLEGWARALELRDQITEGHTRRVTELTVRLAEAMGIGGERLKHIRRGALLHDIGKMAIPDNILMKPDWLDEEEMEIMRKHPTYAVNMLGSIEHLRPALEIPYCHHERWDGSGYPNALRGTEIPLSARIFAVVDVWDALSSDRPYRKALPKEKVLKYIQEESGKHFDPKVVENFLHLNLDEVEIST